jgi:hypothetical protein
MAADVGIWSGLPSTYSYQWQRCDDAGAACTDVNGEQSPTYTTSSADIGWTLRATVAATNSVGKSGSISSSVTAPIEPPPPTMVSPPTITGEARQGETLDETHGTWTNSPTSFSYQWMRCDISGNACSAIAAATGPTHTLSAADVGNTLRVQETASNGGGSSSPTTSGQTTAVLPAAPTSLSLPTITGQARQGQTLNDAHGTWTGNPTSFGYQWLRCDSAANACSAIADATGPTYALTAADVGNTLRVQETASNAGGSSDPATSTPTGVVLQDGPASPGTGPPAISTQTTVAQAAPTGSTRATASVGRVQTAGPVATAVVTCAGPALAHCTITLTLEVTEVVRGSKVIAIVTATAKHNKVHTKQLTVGLATATLNAGHSKALHVMLNSAGRRLLAAHHTLTARLTVSQSGKRVWNSTIAFNTQTKQHAHLAGVKA